MKNKKDYQKIVALDPSYGTLNIGDHIISNCIEKEMSFLFDSSYLVHYSTHHPITKLYQNIFKGPVYGVMKKARYKFIFGTNIIKNNLFARHPDFNITFFDAPLYSNSITIGCGADISHNTMNSYTKKLYMRILSKEYIHSVRDDRTKEILESMGLRALNTGCPTLWEFTDKLCKSIPTKKSKENVVFTLSYYKGKNNNDQKMIDILLRNYKNVYFFPQGYGDVDYLMTFNNIKDITILKPNLKEYDSILKKDIDYVGTRLHAGIYAMRHKKRSIIIAIDNRAKDMDKSNNLKCIDREDIEKKLEKRINSTFTTEIKVNHEAIEAWKDQFK